MYISVFRGISSKRRGLLSCWKLSVKSELLVILEAIVEEVEEVEEVIVEDGQEDGSLIL